jgi:PEGA domain
VRRAVCQNTGLHYYSLLAQGVYVDFQWSNAKIEEPSNGELIVKQCLSILLVFCILTPSSFAQDMPTGAGPATSSGAVPAKPNTLLDGTPVKLRIGRNVSSANATVGEHVDFEALEEVQVQGVVVIAKGATASATVTDAQPKRRMGREGKLDMTLDYVRLVDNEKAALTATAGGKGGTHTGAMVGAMAATAIFTLGGSALFLLMHGKDITITKGTETTAYINGDMPLELARFTPQPEPALVASAQQTPVVATTDLTLVSTPDGADVEVDGAFVGSTPSTITLVSGDHTVRVTKKGYQPYEKNLRTSGGRITLHADLDTAKDVRVTRSARQ